jgi:hypothetical protein
MIETEDGKVFRVRLPQGFGVAGDRSALSGLSQAATVNPTQFARNQVSTGMVAERLQERYAKNILASP